MKKHFIIANWKSYKTKTEIDEWLEKFKSYDATFTSDDVEIVVCPPYLFLPQLKAHIETTASHIKLGVQDVSQFGEGSYTGAINVKQITDDYSRWCRFRQNPRPHPQSNVSTP